MRRVGLAHPVRVRHTAASRHPPFTRMEVLMSQDPSCPQEARSALDSVHQVDRLHGPQLPHLRRAGLILARRGDPSPFWKPKDALELALADIQELLS